jgi:hypothetical protein
LRHALRKPYVQLIQRGERIPFDVAAIRTIEVDHRDLDSVESAKLEIINQVKSMEGKDADVDSPISVAIDLEVLRKSGNPEQRQLADVLAAVGELKSGLANFSQELKPLLADFTENIRRPRIHPGMIEEFAMLYDKLSSLLDVSEGKEMPPSKIEEFREQVKMIGRFFYIIAMESGLPRGLVDEMLERRLRKR